MILKPSDIERLWGGARFRESGCIEFAGPRTPQGYGILYTSRRGMTKPYLAHRVSYAITAGPILDGQIVRHDCDNPPCVNPSHLQSGTRADNMRDKMERGRGVPPPLHIGGAHPNAKLTETDVLQIRADLEDGRPRASIVREYKVSRSLVAQIARREIWTHI